MGAATSLVTGGAGFIGSALVRRLLSATNDGRVIVLDALTYAGTKDNLSGLPTDQAARLELVVGDVRDEALLAALLRRTAPDVVYHLAAETHVDRSIDDPRPFLETNVMGSLALFEALRAGPRPRKIVHVSTDEVLGPAAPGVYLSEAAPTRPSSPYAASKAGGEALALAYFTTHALPVVVARPTNHFGPRQLAEKLVPLVVCRALAGLSLPVYGDGLQRRDWLHVDDGCEALCALADRGEPGRVYHVASGEERTTLEMVGAVCDALDDLRPRVSSHRELITHVTDRPGHDRRYGVDASRIRAELGWAPRHDLPSAIRATALSYLDPAAQARARDHLERRGLGR